VEISQCSQSEHVILMAGAPVGRSPPLPARAAQGKDHSKRSAGATDRAFIAVVYNDRSAWVSRNTQLSRHPKSARVFTSMHARHHWDGPAEMVPCLPRIGGPLSFTIL
jgi:hypothetical protein